MFKILTIFFILMYTYQLISQNRKLKTDMNLIIQGMKSLNEEEKVDFARENLGLIWKTFSKAIGLVIITIIELFYIFCAFSYGSVAIVGGFLVFWVLMYVISSIRAKLNKGKPMKEGYSIFSMFVNIVDLSFFIYIFIQII
ncbi:MAG: hypothetical protein ACRCX8_18830 [Sarcina sp.]